MHYNIRGGGGNSYDVLATILGFAKDLAPPMALLAIKQYLDTMIVPSSPSMESPYVTSQASILKPNKAATSPTRTSTRTRTVSKSSTRSSPRSSAKSPVATRKEKVVGGMW